MESEFKPNRLVDHLHQKAVIHGIPLSGSFELTPSCNMSCNMCYVRKTPEEVLAAGKRLRTVEEWISLAKELRNQGTLFLLLTGGEPLTYPGFWKLYSELRQMGFIVSINTNATLIDRKAVEQFAKDPPQRINITMYGASKETYGRLCHYPDGYEKATNAIEMLQERHINVKLNCSITPDNVNDLEKILAYGKERKLLLQVSSYMFPPLRRDKNSVGVNERFSPEECAYTEAKIRLLKHGTEKLKQYSQSMEKYQNLDEDACCDCEGDRVHCRAGRSAFWVTWDGRLLMCAMMDTPSYDLLENEFADCWEKLRNDSEQIRLPAECSACEAKVICHTCAAMVYTETGSFETKPEYRCDLLRAIPKACKRVLEESVLNEDPV